MIYDFDSLIDKLNYLEEETSPKWGKMNSFKMINHCNNFIEVSMGNQKISLWTRLFGRLFGKVFLKYLKSLDFDINNNEDVWVWLKNIELMDWDNIRDSIYKGRL